MPQATQARQTTGRRALVGGLCALNAVLIALLAGVSLAPRAEAQRSSDRPAANRAPGTYAVVGGAVQSGNSSGIYVLDSTNQEMIALRWLDGQNRLEGIGYTDLSIDAGREPGR